MSNRPLVARVVDRGHQLLLRFNQRRQTRPTYALPAAAQPGQLKLEASKFSARGYEVEAQKGVVYVREKHAVDGSPLIALPVIITVAEVADPGLPVYWFSTGPGSSNMGAAPPEWLLRRFPVVLLGYRAVDGSTRLDSPEIAQAQKGSAHDLHSPASLSGFRGAVAAAVARWRAAGIDLDAFGLQDTAADVEALRAALGHEQILLLAEGYGCRVSEHYAATWPEAVARSVMIGPTAPGGLTWQVAEIDALLDRYATLYERAHPGGDDLKSLFNGALREMPLSWGLFPIDPGKVRFMAFSLLFDRKNSALLFDTLKAAAGGDASGLAMMTILYDVVINSSAAGAVGDLLLKSYQDEPLQADDLGAYGLGSPLSTLLEAGRAAWPDQIDVELGMIRPETLLISGNLDVVAPLAKTETELLPKLTQYHQVVIRDAGHLTDLWRLQPEGIEKLINGFLRAGSLDESGLQYEPVTFKVSQNLAAMMRLLWRVILLFIGSTAACAILIVLWRLF